MAVFVVAACATSLAAAQGAGKDEVVAKLGSAEVRGSELLRLAAGTPPETRDELLQSPESLGRLATTEVFRRAVLAEAKAKGWEKRPEYLEQLERAREQLLVAAFLNDVSRPPTGYPSEQELNDLYQASQAELTSPKQVRLAQIYLSAEKYPDAAKRMAEDLARKAREKGSDFAALAQANSDHKPSAEKGGDMGWLPEDGIVKEVRKAIAKSTQGEIVGPIQAAQGWHVVKLVDTRPAAVRPLAEVREALVAHLRQRKTLENERRYLDDLAARMTLVIDQDALARLRAQETESKSR
jgi:peptidylprolyl isomerase